MTKRISRAFGDFWRDGDTLLFSLCLLANLAGLFLIASATRYAPGLGNALPKQLFASFLGICAFFILHFMDMARLVDKFHTLIFFLGLTLLLLLIPFGNEDGTGNKSWISIPGSPLNLQPAELLKLSFVLLLAYQFCRLEKTGVSRPGAVFLTAGHCALMGLLIFLISKDMGMVLVYLFIYLCMAWIAGVRALWFFLGFALLGAAFYLLWPSLPSYIQMRFLVVFDPALDPQGKGFQQLRSLLAIGSGQLWGQGYGAGTQTQSSASSALPARHTDLIFSVAGEEFGLLGTAFILALLTGLVLRCVFIAYHAKDHFHSYVAAGFVGMVGVQILLNVGMCLYLAPVVGLTLPFFSYGGTSLITLYAAMGMLSNMSIGRKSSTARVRRLYPRRDSPAPRV